MVFKDTLALRSRHPLATGSSLPIMALQFAQSSVLSTETSVVDVCSSSLPYYLVACQQTGTGIVELLRRTRYWEMKEKANCIQIYGYIDTAHRISQKDCGVMYLL